MVLKVIYSFMAIVPVSTVMGEKNLMKKKI